MAELALILGNGFDLDMGLPSRYSDFAKSNEFKAIVKKVSDMYDEGERSKLLILQLQRAYMVSNWFDIEEEIHKYVVRSVPRVMYLSSRNYYKRSRYEQRKKNTKDKGRVFRHS